MGSPDVVIAGAGIIGLSLALELHDHGARVTVFDRGAALSEASAAAAGMLAVSDPANPPALRPLSELSRSLYPRFLDRISELSGQPVPFQTSETVEEADSTRGLSAVELDRVVPGNSFGSHPMQLVEERSVDPRQLAGALLAAVRATRISLQQFCAVRAAEEDAQGVVVETGAGKTQAGYFVDCSGAWARSSGVGRSLPVSPVKGQMIALGMPEAAPLTVTVRTRHVYLVPRTTGPDAGRVVVGATLEQAGFSKLTTPETAAELRRSAAELLPWTAEAPLLEHWAGLRPAAPDQLPLIGAVAGPGRRLLATAHFRNGILLAPGTARMIRAMIFGETSPLDGRAFSPQRTTLSPERAR